MISLFLKRPEMFAVIAAALNGTIGPLSYFAFESGASHNQVAFLKCFGAFLVLLSFCLLNKKLRSQLIAQRAFVAQYAFLSFLGIFCLYFFETWAFSEASVPLVSFLTYAAGGVTLIMSSLFLRERIGFYKLSAFALIITGIYVISYQGVMTSDSSLGIFLALAGGFGYALFIYFSKYLRIEGGMTTLVWLFGFGCIYLSFPLAMDYSLSPSPSASNSFLDTEAVLAIIGLIFLPTIGGFYFTTLAVNHNDASVVQIIETSDPLFATGLSFVILGQIMTLLGYIGAGLIMVGLLLALKRDNREPLGSISS